MKKFVLYLAVFLVCVTSVYPFSVGAWGAGDITQDDDFYDRTLPVRVSTKIVGSSREEYLEINEPYPDVNIQFNNASGRFVLWSYSDLPFDVGQGLLTIGSFEMEAIYEYVDYFSFYVFGNLYPYLTEVRFFLDGTYSVLGSSYMYADDFAVNYENDGYYLNFSVGGTLVRDIENISMYVKLKDGSVFSDTIVNSSYGFSFIAQRLPAFVESVSVSPSSPGPYYPGTDVQLNADVSGVGIGPGTPESAVYWYVHGNISDDTYIDNDGLLTIANDETATALEIEAISTYDTTKSATLELPITYPLDGVQIVPGDTQYLIESARRREIQFSLLLPNGDPFDYQLLEWTTQGDYGTYFRIDDTGLLSIEPNAPAGASCIVHFAYQSDPSTLSPDSVTVQIVTQQEGIYDQLTPTPDQSDKAEQMEDAIGDAAGKLENNNSSLEQLTPSRPQLSTDLQLDQENLLAVSPLVTNIWSINGVGRMIAIVLMVATVAYIFFGKRDG